MPKPPFGMVLAWFLMYHKKPGRSFGIACLPRRRAVPPGLPPCFPGFPSAYRRRNKTVRRCYALETREKCRSSAQAEREQRRAQQTKMPRPAGKSTAPSRRTW